MSRKQHIKDPLDTLLQNRKLVFLSILVLSFIIYGNTLKNEYAFDSTFFVQDNEDVKKGIGGVKEIFTSAYTKSGTTFSNKATGYRPLTVFSFALEHSLFGLNSSTSHLIQILIYALAVFVLFVLLNRIFLNNKPLVFAVCLLFAVHPVHTEIINDVKNRDELFVFLFGILSTLFLHMFADRGQKKHYLLSLLFMFFALLSKENAAVFVGLNFLAVYYFSSLSFKKTLFLIFPGFLLTVAVIAYVFYLSGGVIQNLVYDVAMNSLAGAETLNEKIGTTIYILGKHLQVLIFPHPLLHSYRYATIPVSPVSNPFVLLSMGIHLTAIIFAIKGLRTKSLLSFGIIFYYISIFPYANILTLAPDEMAERYLLTPSLGFLIVFSCVLINIKAFKKYFLHIIFAISIIMSIKVVVRNNDWKDSFTLFYADIQKEPNCAQTNFLLGLQYKNLADNEPHELNRKDLIQSALFYINRAVDIFPAYHRAWKALGDIHLELGNFEESLLYLDRALQNIPPNQVEYIAQTYNTKSLAYQAKQNFESAITEIHKAIDLSNDKKNMSLFYNTLGTNHYYQKDYESAINSFLKAHELNPEYIDPIKNLAITLKDSGDMEKANYYYNWYMSLKKEK